MSKRRLEAAQIVHKKFKPDADDVENGGLRGQKQRTLIFANRGITGHGRHLMNDLRLLVPNCKKESKLGTKGNQLHVINEMCEVAACNNCVFFEQRGNELFMWVSKAPNGPSMKFLVLNIHTMDELKMTGNCLRGSRPFLSFDKSFDEQDHTKLIKQLFTQAFSTPKETTKSKPFIDHVFSFFYRDDRIWFRNFQIVESEAGKKMELALNEIGPRFVLKLVRIHAGSFAGAILYENPNFAHPALKRLANRQKTRAESKLKEKFKKIAKEKPELKTLATSELDPENLWLGDD
eukprot:Phypoly_transcript_14762.p1 GENE.Phypoly_transcript_14762~~Phypoly_transcript_14762.p1  ORF type:complete len:311 (+),score=45.87 Phypoly_transcript_14762:63-935(+)